MVGDTLSSLAVGPILFAVGTSVSAAAIVFSDDFDGGQSTAPGVTAAWSGVTSTENVLGYSAVTGFSGNFLRNTTGGVPTGTPGTATTLTLLWLGFITWGFYRQGTPKSTGRFLLAVAGIGGVVVAALLVMIALFAAWRLESWDVAYTFLTGRIQFPTVFSLGEF